MGLTDGPHHGAIIDHVWHDAPPASVIAFLQQNKELTTLIRYRNIPQKMIRD